VHRGGDNDWGGVADGRDGPRRIKGFRQVHAVPGRSGRVSIGCPVDPLHRRVPRSAAQLATVSDGQVNPAGGGGGGGGQTGIGEGSALQEGGRGGGVGDVRPRATGIVGTERAAAGPPTRRVKAGVILRVSDQVVDLAGVQPVHARDVKKVYPAIRAHVQAGGSPKPHPHKEGGAPLRRGYHAPPAQAIGVRV